jgi:hypothetical protein
VACRHAKGPSIRLDPTLDNDRPLRGAGFGSSFFQRLGLLHPWRELGFSEEPVLVGAGAALRPAPSAADEPLLVFGVTLTSDRDPGECDFDRAQVLVGKLNGDRPEVLVQAF